MRLLLATVVLAASAVAAAAPPGALEHRRLPRAVAAFAQWAADVSQPDADGAPLLRSRRRDRDGGSAGGVGLDAALKLAATRAAAMHRLLDAGDYAGLYAAAASVPPHTRAALPRAVVSSLGDVWVSAAGDVEVLAAVPREGRFDARRHVLRTLKLTTAPVALGVPAAAAVGGNASGSDVAVAGVGIGAELPLFLATAPSDGEEAATGGSRWHISASHVPAAGVLLTPPLAPEPVLIVGADGEGGDSAALPPWLAGAARGAYCDSDPSVLAAADVDDSAAATTLAPGGLGLHPRRHGGHHGFRCIIGGQRRHYASPHAAAAAAADAHDAGVRARLLAARVDADWSGSALSARRRGSSVSDRRLAVNPAYSTGTRSLLMLRLYFVDQPPSAAMSAADAEAVLANVTAEAGRMSFAAVNINGTVYGSALQLTLLATFRSPGSSAIREEATRVAAAVGVNLAAYDHVVMLLPTMGWGTWATATGLGSVLGSYVW